MFVIIVIDTNYRKDGYLMKAATGELNLTVITLIAIGAVIAFFWFMWGPIKNGINNQWNDINTNDRNTRSSEGGSLAP